MKKDLPQIFTIDKYIEQFPKEVQVLLQKIRKLIKALAPEAVEAISYGIPTYKLNGNLVHFAAYKSHIGFYPGSRILKELDLEIKEYKTGKGTIQFPLNAPIPYELIEKIVKQRVKENLKK